MLRVKTEDAFDTEAPTVMPYDPDVELLNSEDALDLPTMDGQTENNREEGEQRDELMPKSEDGIGAAGDADVKPQGVTRGSAKGNPDEASARGAQIDDETQVIARGLNDRLMRMLPIAGVEPPTMTEKANPVGEEADEMASDPAAEGIEEREVSTRGSAVSDLSLHGALPSGPTMVAAGRIRKTINGYVEDLRHNGWYDSFKLGTVSSVVRRLENHQDKIIGKDESPVADTLEHFSVLLGYLATVDVPLSETLTSVFQYAIFQADFKRSGAVSGPIKRFDMDVIGLAKARATDEPDRMEVVEVPTEGGDERAAEESDAPKGRKPMKAAKKPVLISTQVIQGGSATDHFERVVAEALKGYMAGRNANVLDSVQPREDLMNEVHNCIIAWDARCSEADEGADGETDFTKVFHAIDVIVKCLCTVEQCRPASKDVRAARRTVLDSIRVGPSTPMTELARAVAKFEDTFDQAFKDIHAWRDLLARECNEHGSLDHLTKQYAGMTTLLNGISHSLAKWSTSALQENLAEFGSSMTNCKVLIDIVLYMHVHVFYDSFAINFGTCATDIATLLRASEKLAICDSNGSVDQEASALSADGMDDFKIHLQEFKQNANISADKLVELNSRWVAVLRQLFERAGKAVSDYFEESEMTAVTFEGSKTSTVFNISDMTTYISYCIGVASDRFKGSEVTTDSAKFIEFAGLAKHLSDIERFPWDVKSVATVSEIPKQTITAFKTFADCIGRTAVILGKQIYDDCMAGFVSKHLNDLGQKLEFTIGEVHDSVVQQANGHELFKILVRGVADVKGLIPECMTKKLDKGVTTMLFTSTKYNAALTDLKLFLEASSTEHLKVEGMVKVSNPEVVEVPVRHATAYMSIMNAMRDLVGCAAAANSMLFTEVGYVEGVSHESACSPVTIVLKLLADCLVKVDALLHNKDAYAIEKDGWTTGVNLNAARQWVHSMGTFNKNCRGRLLTIMGDCMKASTTACSSEYVDWAAAFDKTGKLNLPLATKLFFNKLDKVAAVHIKLRQYVADVNAAAHILGITPRIQDLEITASTISLAMASLATRGSKGGVEHWSCAPRRDLMQTAKASQLTAVIRGVSLLGSLANKPTGPSEARAFTLKHKVPKNKDIPEGFWDELAVAAPLSVSESAGAEEAPREGIAKSASGSGLGIQTP
ncbi:unnamed protein product, partial [Prorocentrum cordatum]